ncbi:TIGR03668 family PPOX class F420-dependent oxidoreductase [Saccharopolyspora sp. HNM0986]|uniref:TIGR03668 family PPOX class F420-dependent oxidoreductase n=1 Tax=Saccharopolyspora galaxeae TaxID=2781241 RepID=UPI00190BAF0C|nr:TIGR03668 family PPOX class F420-dependent oxidoreductase [Saccharopolyspora sp. HNM0986]MBK0866315.1 TIGR03668 family PPOX class F420-dependent oxidoreductase [Saccharopolyspora sp. HNM0986]
MRISQEKARYWFSTSRVARLGTADSAGAPHLVPVTFAVRENVVVTAVDHKPKTTTSLKRLRNITENPRVSLLVDHYEHDWSALWWVRADGVAEIVAAADHPELTEALAAKYEQYRNQPPQHSMIVARIERWSGWSAS